MKYLLLVVFIATMQNQLFCQNTSRSTQDRKNISPKTHIDKENELLFEAVCEMNQFYSTIQTMYGQDRVDDEIKIDQTMEPGILVGIFKAKDSKGNTNVYLMMYQWAEKTKGPIRLNTENSETRFNIVKSKELSCTFITMKKKEKAGYDLLVLERKGEKMYKLCKTKKNKKG